LNRNLLFVALALLLWGFGEGMFFNFVPIYLDKQFLLSKYEIGWVLGAFGFSMAVTHIPAGFLADRIGRRPLLITAWLLGLVSALVMGSALVLPLFLIGLFGYGLTAFVSSPLSSYITAARGKWPVGTALSFGTATFALGMVLGPVTGGWIGDNYGMRMSFLVAAAIFVVSNVCIFFIERQPIDHHDPEAPPPDLLSNRRFLLLMGVLAFAMFAMYLSQRNRGDFYCRCAGEFPDGDPLQPCSSAPWIFARTGIGHPVCFFYLERCQPAGLCPWVFSAGWFSCGAPAGIGAGTRTCPRLANGRHVWHYGNHQRGDLRLYAAAGRDPLRI
jgi:MFS family permease